MCVYVFVGFHELGSMQDYFSSDLSFNHNAVSLDTDHQFFLFLFFHNPAARLLVATSLADDASSQHSSDQSDTRTEHSDEDVAEKTPKRSSTTKTTKKPATVKTEVDTHTHTLQDGVHFSRVSLVVPKPAISDSSPSPFFPLLLASNQDDKEAGKEEDHHQQR